MKRNIAKYIVGIVCLLCCSSTVGWGQKTYTINYKNNGTKPQTDVPTFEQTVYIDDNEKRELFVEDLRINHSYWYEWFVRWYRVNPKTGEVCPTVNMTTTSVIRESDANDGGNATKGQTYDGALKNAKEANTDNKSLFWYHGLSSGNASNSPCTSRPPGASTVIYTGKNYEDIVICDVSHDMDGLGYHYNDDATVLTEPTMTKRYRFVIKKASDMRTALNAVTGNNALKTYDITVPTGASNVNLQLDMTPENYYWGTNKQGDTFVYSINEGTKTTVTHSSGKLINLSTVSKNITVRVWAKDGTEQSPMIAQFNITIQDDSGFMLESNVKSSTDPYRNPDNYPEMFEQVGYNDFDGGTVIKKSQLTAENNMSTTPLNYLETSYGFINPALYSISGKYLNITHNFYGLFRSANVSKVSTNGEEFVKTWKGRRGVYETNDVVKGYLWYYPLQDRTDEFYDRTYTRTNGNSCGYFFYTDASLETGRVIDVPIKGTVCGGTELTIVLWAADLTQYNNGTNPNFNLVLYGVKYKSGSTSEVEEEKVLHQFSTGEAVNKLIEWQQLSYRVSVKAEDANRFDHFYLQVRNNAENTDGNDFAFDDVRIYKSLPNIQVQRQDACTASTLLVSLDYPTLLRNMGWNLNANVLEDVDLSDPFYRKYRYGLMGENPYASVDRSNYGNVYSAFVDGEGNWVTINKSLEDDPDLVKLGLHKSYRAVIQTDLNTATEILTPSTQEEALKSEIILNVRAMNDYNADLFQRDEEDEKGNLIPAYYTETTKPIDFIDLKPFVKSGTPTSNGIYTGDWVVNVDAILADPAEYERTVVAFYKALQIPRIRCSWTNSDRSIVYLKAIDVFNSDLKYVGEVYYDEQGKKQTADGKYSVVLFRPTDLANGDATVNVNDPCTLKSPFVVKPSITITVDSDQSHSMINCYGNIRTFTAQLWVEDGNGNMVKFENSQYKGSDYTFDWFLGSREAYDKYTTSGTTLHDLIVKCRNSLNNYTGVLTVEQINKSKLSDEEKKLLIGLLGDEPMLISGKTVSLFWIGHLIAMPYIPDYQGKNEYIYSFCTQAQDLELEGEWNTPELSVGIPGIVYPINDVPLRLGLRHIAQGKTLSIPIQNDINFGVAGNDGGSLGILPSNKNVLLRQSNNVYQVVGTLVSLSAKKNSSDNKLTVKFDTTSGLFEEGKVYSLYVPFGEYDSNGKLIEDACEGYAVLQIKIVPEFLTWQKGSGDVWYNDSNWKQSTESELYKGNKGNVDANGSDNVANAFAPLYFTKITIPGSQTLELENLSYTDNVLQTTDKATANIQYEMAVDTVQGGYKISPYYINKVSEIYFKPNAQLRHQQYLIYDTARVDFEMAKDAKYWMASPLQDVFAGDMYAPKGTARQETYAFDPIFYSESAPNSGNDRQNPAFYQKAWDKGITMYTNTEGSASTSYSVVNSNWSIEYNDVNVPYALGKGFYASVEEFTNDEGKALVRLPKADDGYKYEELKSTKALSTIDKRPNTGKLAGEDDIIVVLSDSDDKDLWGSTDDYPIADGDGKHFLLGNPYMYPLDIKKFLTENTVLAQKYWTLSADGTLSVGTPDVAFTWTDGTTVSGEIAPMQAFFVELQDSLTGNSSKQVTFKTNMMVEPETKTTLRSTTATHPVLALRAEKNNLQSIAFVTVRDDATNAYESDKDAVVMIDSELTDIPQVYTVAGDRAAGVNAVKSLVNVPLGVYAASDKEEVTLTIEGVSNFIGTLYLYDAVTGKSQALVGDSHTFYVTGSTHGRYFLRSSESPTTNETVQADAISIYSAVPGKVVVSATERLKQVQVFTTSGTLVRSLQPNQSVHTFDLSQGLYLIRAVTDGMVKTEKVLVR